MDECTLNIHSCDNNAYCTNSLGSYNCTCYPEYNGNGTSCTGRLLVSLFGFYSVCNVLFQLFVFYSLYPLYILVMTYGCETAHGHWMMMMMIHCFRPGLQPGRSSASLAQLGERRSAEREVAGSNPSRTNTQGSLNNWEEITCKWLDFLVFSDKDEKP